MTDRLQSLNYEIQIYPRLCVLCHSLSGSREISPNCRLASFSLWIKIFETEIELYLSSVLKKNFDDSLETTLNRSKFKFFLLILTVELVVLTNLSPWMSTRVCFLQKRYQVHLLCTINPTWLWRAAAALVSLFSSHFYSQGGIKK